jgi:hypothetical protein
LPGVISGDGRAGGGWEGEGEWRRGLGRLPCRVALGDLCLVIEARIFLLEDGLAVYSSFNGITVKDSLSPLVSVAR